MTELKSVYEDKPYIKISKMSRGWQWEIKCLGDDEETIKKIMKIDKELNEKYGSNDE